MRAGIAGNFEIVGRSRLHLYSLLVAFATLLLVMTGVAVTSSQGQPRQAPLENVHVVIAVAQALLAMGLAIALSLADKRLSRVGWIVLIALIFEACLGVPPMRSSGPVIGTLHAALAALLFAGFSAIALMTSRSWQRAPDFVQDYGWPSLRFLSKATAFLVAVQVGYGAGFRHSAVGVLPHLLGALVVALIIMITGAFVSNQFPTHPTLRPMAVALMVITGIQVFLGMAAFLMRMMEAAAPMPYLIVSIAHVATGSLTFAASVLLAIEVRRSVQPRSRKGA